MSRSRIAPLVAALAAAIAMGCGADEPPLPEMLPISEFTLTSQDGAPFGTEQLRGQVWVVDMIFTSCPDVCPLLSTKMANLHRRLDREGVHFVSVSVDPSVDTPAVLREYAARYGADTRRWTFLTGTPEQVREVVVRSLHMPVEEPREGAEGRRDVLHSPRFLLVDRSLTLRGLYDTDREGLERLEHDVGRLLAEER